MRKWLVVLTVSVLLVALLAPSALAEPKPDPANIPKPWDPGGGFPDWWVELDPREGGTGNELPQGANDPMGGFGVDDFIRGGPVDGGIQHGIPIGFNFKYMQGPAEGIPIVGPGGVLQAWRLELTDEGYDELYVSLNGYVAFDTYWPPGTRPAGDFNGLGTRAWNPRTLPSAGVPNCFIAPYWTDLAIADNSFAEVTSVGFVCVPGPADPACTPLACNVPGPARYSRSSCCAGGTGYWMPCTTRGVQRPRGKLLYKTVGTEPDRRFIVQWSYAKNIWTGNLATFQAQLWENGNRILFLYKDFTTKAHYEDPPHDDPYFVRPGLVVGLEDWYGTTGLGWLYLPERTVSVLPVGQWRLINPLADLTVIGFAP
jgi:hypothetical protein